MNILRVLVIAFLGMAFITVFWVGPETLSYVGKSVCHGPNGTFARMDGGTVTGSGTTCVAPRENNYTYPVTVTLITGEELTLTVPLLPASYEWKEAYTNLKDTFVGKILVQGQITIVVTIMIVLLLFIAAYNEYCIYRRQR